jgi:hypothetical protein
MHGISCAENEVVMPADNLRPYRWVNESEGVDVFGGKFGPLRKQAPPPSENAPVIWFELTPVPSEGQKPIRWWRPDKSKAACGCGFCDAILEAYWRLVTPQPLKEEPRPATPPLPARAPWDSSDSGWG